MDALALEGDEGPWQAAISLGEPQAGFDPGISEWGETRRDELSLQPAEYIGRYELTQGSEPSQYLKENKSQRFRK